MSGARGINRLLRENKGAMLIAPIYGPAWLSDLVHGDQYDGPSASMLPTAAGYLHLSVPMGTAWNPSIGNPTVI